jgi:hypothetical protein
MKCVECNKWEAIVKHADIFIEDEDLAKAVTAENICMYCLIEALDIEELLSLKKPIIEVK